MPRTQTANLTTMFAAGNYRRVDTIDVYLANGTVKRLSRGAATRGGNAYQDYIRSVGDFVKTDREVDRLSIVGQNVNSEIGLLAASDLRLLDYAVADYGRIYSNAGGGTIEDVPQMFRGVVSEAEISEKTFSLTFVSDFESIEALTASRGLKEKCVWGYKNGRECTSTSSLPTCPKNRLACAARGKEWEYGGWEFFEDPTDSAPGTAGNSGGIGGCFALDTTVKLVSGDAEIGSLPLGLLSEPVPVYSFDPLTETVEEDLIEEVWEYRRRGFYTLRFEHGTLNVSGEHPLFRGMNQFCRVDEWRLKDAARFFKGAWRSSNLISMKRHFSAPITVRNFRVRKNKTYFANNCGVHNNKEFSGDGGGF